MALDGEGNIYVVFADKESGHSDTDIYILKSEDEGVTWSVPGGSGTGYKRVNSGGAGTADQDQWFPWIAWDDCTGALVVVYYDSRDNTARVNTYLAVSYDEGATWNGGYEFRVSDVDWDGDPPNSAFGDPWAGDYIGVAARDGVACPVWSDDRVTSHSYRVYTSPVYLWGVVQSSVTDSVINEDLLQLTVKAKWNTDLTSSGADSLILTSPQTHTQYIGTATPPGATTSHAVTKLCTCETGDWTCTVKSTRPGFTPRVSTAKTIRIYNCVD
jgi:hypothetical protein